MELKKKQLNKMSTYQLNELLQTVRAVEYVKLIRSVIVGRENHIIEKVRSCDYSRREDFRNARRGKRSAQ